MDNFKRFNPTSNGKMELDVEGDYVQLSDHDLALAQIEGLKAQRTAQANAHAAHAAELKAKLAAAKRDAERWNWLKDGGHGYNVVKHLDADHYPIDINAWELDAHADLAIAAARMPSAAQGVEKP